MQKTKPDQKTYAAVLLFLIPVALLLTLFISWYAELIDENLFTARRLSRQAAHLEYIERNSDDVNSAYRSFRNNRSLTEMLIIKNQNDPGKVLLSVITRSNKTACKINPDTNKATPGSADYQSVSLSFKTTCKMHEMYNFLLSLHNARPLLFIDELIISSRDKSYNTLVEAKVTVSAYVI